MPTDIRTSELVINKLTKQQYENIQNPSPTELYLVPEDEEHKPICYPTTASEVKTTSMLVKSSIDGNGRILTENGFVYNTSGNPTISDTKVICDLGVGLMEKKLENLAFNTEYHIKSYGQNNSGLVYGSELVQRTSFIPEEYQLVEYLGSGGTQYIDLQYYPNTNTEVTTIFYPFRATGNDGVFGASGYYEAPGRAYSIGIIGSKYIVDRGNQRFSTNIAVILNTWIKISLKPEGFYLNDNLEQQLNGGPFSSSTILRIFSRTSEHPSGVMYISYFKVNDPSVNIELYPVYRIADNKPGMYDVLNQTFYTNSGTGEFIVGPDKEFDE